MASTINASTSSGLVNTADTSGVLQLQTANTTAVTIDTSQRVGIGTASPSTLLHTYTASGGNKLTVEAGAASQQAVVSLITNATTPGQCQLYMGKSGATTNGQVGYDPGSDAMYFYTSNAERMRISSAGYVGIGVTNPTQPLQISGGSATEFDMFVSGTRTGTLYTDSTQMIVSAATAIPMIFQTSATERMRIDSSGNVFVGTTNTASGGFEVSPDYNSTASSAFIVGHASGSASGAVYGLFRYGANSIGSITQTGTTAVLYNTTSDYRLKNDVTPIQNALATVEALNPVSFTWIDGRKDDGFIAHEIQAVIPNCVTGEKDAVNEDGTPKYQQMDNSGVIPFLVKAIQEQQALITDLTTRLAALEGAK